VAAIATCVLLLVVAGAAPAQEGREHVVRRGETLWGISARLLGNPHRWTEIYKLNPGVVEDPHWIYPSERLVLPLDSGPTAGETAPPRGVGVVTRREARARAGRADPFAGPSVFTATAQVAPTMGAFAAGLEESKSWVSVSDHYGAGFLARPRELRPIGRTGRILAENPLALEIPPGVRMHDRVMVDLGGIDARVGDRLQAIHWGRSVDGFGRVAESMGLLDVTDVEGDSARARVTRLFGNFRVGDPVIPTDGFEPRVGNRPQPVEGGLTARVIAFKDPQVVLGLGEIVWLDIGAAAGAHAGDELAVFPGTSDPASARLEDRLAIVRIVRVRDRSSAAMVVSVRDPGMAPGSVARVIRVLSGRSG